jgi:hypothetical protein
VFCCLTASRPLNELLPSLNVLNLLSVYALAEIVVGRPASVCQFIWLESINTIVNLTCSIPIASLPPKRPNDFNR